MPLTALEEATFVDGFRIVLLLADLNPAQNRLAYHVRQIEGGRCTEDEHVSVPYGANDAEPFQRLQHFVTRVSAEPHVLVGAGRGWQDLLTAFLPQASLDALRILDLRAALSAFAPEVKVSTFPEGFARAFGQVWRADETALPIDLVEDLLWHLVHLAGTADLTWAELLIHAQTSRHNAPFERFSFSAEELNALPAGPGVYIMYDKAGQPIYVGKAQNLQQRVSGYFSSQKTVPEKLQTLWQKLTHLEVRPVGSELEALLLEHKLIQELTPPVNVQRKIAEGRSRYGSPRGTVVLLCPSVKAGHQELFWIGLAGSTYQLRVNPKRPPLQQLRLLQTAAKENRAPRKASTRLTNWGATGSEIASRYYGRFRNQLTWLEPGALDERDFVDRLTPLMQKMMTRASDPAELRLHDW